MKGRHGTENVTRNPSQYHPGTDALALPESRVVKVNADSSLLAFEPLAVPIMIYIAITTPFKMRLREGNCGVPLAAGGPS